VDELVITVLASSLNFRRTAYERATSEFVAQSGSNHQEERRGFASMSREKQREIASKGGRAAHEKGTAHEWTPDEARAAGRKGGQSSRGGRGRLVPIPAQQDMHQPPGMPRRVD
jgi:general stress protein YciG